MEVTDSVLDIRIRIKNNYYWSGLMTGSYIYTIIIQKIIYSASFVGEIHHTTEQIKLDFIECFILQVRIRKKCLSNQ